MEKRIDKNLHTWVFCFLFGMLGADRFVRGQIGLGILKLITGGGFAFWWFVDFIIAIVKAYATDFRNMQDFIFVGGNYLQGYVTYYNEQPSSYISKWNDNPNIDIEETSINEIHEQRRSFPKLYRTYDNAYEKLSDSCTETEIEFGIKPTARTINFSKYPRHYIVYDLETTGLDPIGDEIIEIGAIEVNNGKEIASFSKLTKPIKRISEKIEEITGITNEMLHEAEGISGVLQDFLEFKGDLPLIGYNNHNFDDEFLLDKLDRCNLECVATETFDVIEIAKKILDYGAVYDNGFNFKLVSICEFLGFENENAHRALSDARATSRVYEELLDRCQQITTHPDFIKKPKCVSDKLEGETVCFTGFCDSHDTHGLQIMALEHGANLSANVTKKTTLLVNLDSEVSGKERKAKEYGVRIIELKEFLSLIES